MCLVVSSARLLFVSMKLQTMKEVAFKDTSLAVTIKGEVVYASVDEAARADG